MKTLTFNANCIHKGEWEKRFSVNSGRVACLIAGLQSKLQLGATTGDFVITKMYQIEPRTISSHHVNLKKTFQSNLEGSHLMHAAQAGAFSLSGHIQVQTHVTVVYLETNSIFYANNLNSRNSYLYFLKLSSILFIVTPHSSFNWSLDTKATTIRSCYRFRQDTDTLGWIFICSSSGTLIPTVVCSLLETYESCLCLWHLFLLINGTGTWARCLLAVV